MQRGRLCGSVNLTLGILCNPNSYQDSLPSSFPTACGTATTTLGRSSHPLHSWFLIVLATTINAVAILITADGTLRDIRIREQLQAPWETGVLHRRPPRLFTSSTPPSVRQNRSLIVKSSAADRTTGRLAGEGRHKPNHHRLGHPFVRAGDGQGNMRPPSSLDAPVEECPQPPKVNTVLRDNVHVNPTEQFNSI